MTREAGQQGLPKDGGVDSDFPIKSFEAGAEFFRCSRYAPWYFANVNQSPGRFTLPEPNGTCYLASSAEGALRESVGPSLLKRGLLVLARLQGLSVYPLRLPEDRQVAHVTSKRAIIYGVLGAELCAMTPYGVPQAWARAFHTAGFDGVWGTLRFSTPSERGLALFGEGGGRPWPVGDRASAVSVARRMQGVRIVDIPDQHELTFGSMPD